MPDVAVRRLRIMISSTRQDLKQYREEAFAIIRKVAEEKQDKVQLTEVSMEKETQTGNREFAVAVSKRWVQESDWIVVLVGWNYGTISDEEGANGLSVTEWEYMHAAEQGKKLFVFIAGDLNTPNGYRCSDEEQIDLKDAFFSQNDEQNRKLQSFKKELAKAHVEYFKNLAHFRERLEKTIKNAIDDLPIVVEPGSRLADLFLAVTADIQNCIQQVNRLAACKKIHDCLHDLRHKVIRRLREEILPSWKDEGALGYRKAGFIANRANEAQLLLGRIQEMQESIAFGNAELIRLIEHLLGLPALWDSENPCESVEEFTETVEVFADAVQYAFTEADKAMRLEERALAGLHTTLRQQISGAPESWYLSAAEHQTLESELERIALNEKRLATALSAHHKWQDMHDQLEHLQGFRGMKSFQRKLKDFINMGRKTLLELIRQQVDANASGSKTVAQTSQDGNGKGVRFSTLPSASECANGSYNLQSDLQKLDDFLRKVGERIDDEALDNLLVLFDEAFYQVDKCTKAEVARAQDRVVAFQQLLTELARVVYRRE